MSHMDDPYDDIPDDYYCSDDPDDEDNKYEKLLDDVVDMWIDEQKLSR